MRLIVLLAACVAAISAGLLPEEVLLKGRIPTCKDGKGPLLAADRVYSCEGGCPQGFVCEYQDQAKTAKNGICCPDLEVLYRLYGDDSAGEQMKKPTNEFI